MRTIITTICIYLVAWIGVNNFAPTEDYIAESLPLISIADNSEIHGSSFLFSGSLNENPVYWYYEEQENGYIQLRSTPANLVYIRYTTSEPSIDTYNRRYKTKWLNRIFIATDNYGKVIRIPENSIVSEFKLDTKK